MTEQQIQELVQQAVAQAIQAERIRMASVFRNAAAEYTTDWNGTTKFDFEISCEHIARSIEQGEPPRCAGCDDDPAEPGSILCATCTQS